MCATETTIGRMKIGDKLLFGAYGVSNDDPHPILWLKGTPNGDFITQDVVDYIAFDARERNSESYSIRNWGIRATLIQISCRSSIVEIHSGGLPRIQMTNLLMTMDMLLETVVLGTPPTLDFFTTLRTMKQALSYCKKLQ